MTRYRIAVVGATGAVGTEMLRLLRDRRWAGGVELEIVPFASERSEGKVLDGGLTVRGLVDDERLDGFDVALFSAGGSISKAWAPAFAKRGAIVVDNSSAFRMDPDVPLVIPEINADALASHRGIIANPNCTTITALMAAAPLHRAAGLRQLVLSSYQSVSGSGMKGVRELAEQNEKLAGMEEQLIAPEHDALPVGDVYGKTVAFNVLPFQFTAAELDWTDEERKVLGESRKILSAPDLEIAATVVRVPVVVGHAVSIFAAFSRPITPGEAREVLSSAPGVRVVDDPANAEYPTPLDSAGIDDVLVGRIRAIDDRDDALLLFAAGDNLRKGAALNAVQIAEALPR
jgi:aspartate-semialdehyde dehydrogenase